MEQTIFPVWHPYEHHLCGNYNGEDVLRVERRKVQCILFKKALCQISYFPVFTTVDIWTVYTSDNLWDYTQYHKMSVLFHWGCISVQTNNTTTFCTCTENANSFQKSFKPYSWLMVDNLFVSRELKEKRNGYSMCLVIYAQRNIMQVNIWVYFWLHWVSDL